VKIQVKKGDITQARTDAIVILFYEGIDPWGDSAQRLNEACGGMIREFIESGEFDGKLNQISVLFPQGRIGAKRIVLAGMGKKGELTLDKTRGVFAKAAQCVRSLKLKSFSTTLDRGLLPFPHAAAVEALIEGIRLGLYRFTVLKTIDQDNAWEVENVILYEIDAAAHREASVAAKTVELICDAVYFARDLVSMPSNRMTPTDLAREARRIAQHGKSLACRVLDLEEMKKLGMNALLGVAQGSDQPPKFIILEYRGAKKSEPPIVLVGKGITFDSGGISLKPAEKMDEMKTDMAGAAAVMAAVHAAANMKIPLNVVGLMPATENLPSGKAYKPGDVLTALSGKTIEVLNTDAEGRLILADALAYADRLKPTAILDIATLTGACIIALGEQTIGMMGTDEALKARVRKSADATGEKVWELPLWEEYHEQIKSDVADFKNTGGRPAGTITAAAFLSKFAGDRPWVHLDIAGPAWLTKDRPYIPKGASGVGVRLFIDLLRNWPTAA
jgi:leucyl aminopeptidase